MNITDIYYSMDLGVKASIDGPLPSKTSPFAKPTGLYHPVAGVTNPKYKLLHFLTTNFFAKRGRH